MPCSPRVALLLVLAAALPFPAAAAERAALVRDLKDAPSSYSSWPQDFLPFGDTSVLFLASTPQHGVEPWVSDGTVAGTHLLKDLEPGPDTLEYGGIRCATAFAGGMLFLSPSSRGLTTGESTYMLWRTDGTSEGTLPVAPIAGQGACRMIALHDRVLFTIVRRIAFSSWALELWSSDGTMAATQRLAAFETEFQHSTELMRAGDLIFFTPRTEAGVEIWRSDGSPDGTRMVIDLVPGPEDASPSLLGSIGDLIVFSAVSDGGAGTSLWRSDGTASGTVLLAPPTPFGYALPTAARGRLILSSGDHLVTTDGRPDGTADHAVGWQSALLATVGDGVFILEGTSSTRLWRWDDFDAAPRLVADVPGAFRGRHAVLPGALLFRVQGLDGNQLWRSDGTAEGTTAIFTSALPDAIDTLAASGARAFFSADGPVGDLELWSSDGSVGGTARLANLAADDLLTGSSNPRSLAVIGARVVFAAQADNDVELWRSDGSAAGTELLRDLPPLSGGSVLVSNSVQLGGALYFGASSANPGVGNGGLWRTDGTAAGTALAVPLASGRIASLAAAGDALFFATDEADAAVCRTQDGESGMTCGRAGRIGVLHAFGDRVVFRGGPERDQEPWISDGTEAGTMQIRDLRAGASSNPAQFTALGAELYFVASDPDGASLWRTDGTEQGTQRVRQLAGIQRLTSVAERLFFVVGSLGDPGELWTSDGSEAGTHPVSAGSPVLDTVPGPPLSHLGRSVLFMASDGVHGAELWRSDGTAGGTRLVRDIVPGAASSGPRDFVAAGDRLTFVACTTLGCEPWVTDGTAAGTALLADIAPGVASSEPSEPVVVADTLYLAATDVVHGRELWRVALTGSCAADCNGDGSVSIAEVITSVAIALGARPAADCVATDSDGDGAVTISELVAGVVAALQGCS